MKTNNWVEWCLVGLLAVGGSWMATGCGGGDDDEDAAATTVIAVTNTVGGVTQTNTVVVPNPPVVTPTDNPIAFRLLAPKLKSPADGENIEKEMGTGKVTMRWEAVAGAATYIVEVNGTKFTTDGQSLTRIFNALAPNTWRVWGQTASKVDGWKSATRTFVIVLKPVMP